MQTLASTLGISRRRLGRILGSTVVFSALVVVLVVFVLGKEETTARTAATKFAVALVHDKPTAAPRGATDYVGGVRDYFGPVSSARVIAAHNKGVNTGDNADTRSFFVVEMLLESKRGPAVIELEFDNHALFSEEVSRVYELAPDHAPALSRADREDVDAAFARRGGVPADAEKLSVAPADAENFSAPRLPSTQRVAGPTSKKADAQLRCVQRAHGDVFKMQKCVKS